MSRVKRNLDSESHSQEHKLKNPRVCIEDEDKTQSTIKSLHYQVEVSLPYQKEATRNHLEVPNFRPQRLTSSYRVGCNDGDGDSTSSGSNKVILGSSVPTSRGQEQSQSLAHEKKCHSSDDSMGNDHEITGHDSMDEMEDTEDTSDMDDIDDTDDESLCDEYARFEWLESIHVNITCIKDSTDPESHTQVGSSHGKLITTSLIRGTFYADMDEADSETSCLAFDLFDRYGRLRPEFKTHSVKKGTGVFQDELNKANILFIEDLKIDKSHRMRGLGRKAISEMLASVETISKSSFFAITRPEWYPEVDENSVFKRPGLELEKQIDLDRDAAIAFWRRLGFRRIGSSPWFGFASFPSHPSRSLAETDDYNPSKGQHPLGDEKFDELQEAFGKKNSVQVIDLLEQSLQDWGESSPRWLMANSTGNTLLHGAALGLLSEVISWILSRSFGSILSDSRNDEGETPLEALLFCLEKRRTQLRVGGFCRENISDAFEGHDLSSIYCICKLRGVINPSRIDIARVAFGCTCGQCVSGFLSPRMQVFLDNQAQTKYDHMNMYLNNTSGPDWVKEQSLLDRFDYLPESVRNNLETNKSMRQGFVNICNYISECLLAKQVPSAENVVQKCKDAREWPPCTKNFLERGGTVASVANMLFQSAMNQDILAGDGTADEIFHESISALPPCRNDHEFGFVSGMCGYERMSQVRLFIGWSDAHDANDRGISEAEHFGVVDPYSFLRAFPFFMTNIQLEEEENAEKRELARRTNV